MLEMQQPAKIRTHTYPKTTIKSITYNRLPHTDLNYKGKRMKKKTT